jgi:putative endonuclease
MNLPHTAQEIGRLGERIAARYLKRHGYRIVKRNLHYGKNELDLIAKNKQFLLFVEVKARSYASTEEAALDRPSAAVDADKRRRTLQAAREHLRARPTKLCPRFDVIEVYLSREKRPKAFKINHIEAAFDAKGRVR